MKVAFNARLLSSPTLRGWNRYTINLLVALSSLDIELFLYSDSPLDKNHLAKLPKDSYQVRISPPMRYILWEQYWLPKQCQKDKIDILHCPMNFGLPWFSPCPRILTLHDAIDQVYYFQDIPWYQRLSLAGIPNKLYHWVARHRADHIITVSEYSKQDFIKYFQIPKEKITVIYEAADPNFHNPIIQTDRQALRTKYQLNLPYIFYVGGWEKRKNIPFLLQAFAEAKLNNVELVLVGGKDEQRESLVQLGESLGITDRLRLLGWVDDADLAVFYAEAICFVYPSEYEGFGLQLCEAIALGCPVLAARSTCLPEILGNGGETFGLDNFSELSKLMIRLTEDEAFLENLKGRANQRSKYYSWTQTAIATTNLYVSTIKNVYR
jgi:glycosyltransferase involved in cell wall biosynthesis